MAVPLLPFVINKLNAPVALRLSSGVINVFPGTQVMNMILSGQLRIEDIEEIHFRGTLRLIPLTPLREIEDDTFNVLYELSDDFADNNEAITFWYLEDIVSRAVYGVFRDSQLVAAL
jgi:hypothetical protein